MTSIGNIPPHDQPYAILLQVNEIAVAVANLPSFMTLVALSKSFLPRYGFTELDFNDQCPSYETILQWTQHRKSILPLTLFHPVRIQLIKIPVL